MSAKSVGLSINKYAGASVLLVVFFAAAMQVARAEAVAASNKAAAYPCACVLQQQVGGNSTAAPQPQPAALSDVSGDASVEAPPDLAAALDLLITYKPSGRPVTDPAVSAAKDALDLAVREPRKMDLVLRARLDGLISDHGDLAYVSPSKPVSESDPLRWVLVNYESARLQVTLPAATVAHTNASEFPGAVPSSAMPVTRVVTVDATTGPAAWRSTGLYAAPGALVTLTAEHAAQILGKGLLVRVGAHSDSLRNRLHKRYLRMPEISRVFPMDHEITEAANAFGGLIYVIVPANSQLGTIKVTIQGAVEAPYYVEGKTTAEEWKAIRNNPAPWGELEAKDVIFTVPSDQLRKVEDPAGVAAFWDKIVGSVAEFMGRPEGVLSFTSAGPSRPERYVADVDISAGAMHAGYPIMTFLNAVPTEIDIATFKGERTGAKTWGLLHELGHNYQTQVMASGENFRDWTTGDAGEVTNNMAPLYVAEQLGMSWQAANPSLLKSRASALGLIASGQKPWQEKDLFVKLYMFVELSAGIGWASIHKVLAEYYSAQAADRPKTDEEKRDQWLVRLSATSGKNLGPFFTRWGYDTSDSARARVAELPAWLPDEWDARAAESPVAGRPVPSLIEKH